jgi:hypothetical protein
MSDPAETPPPPENPPMEIHKPKPVHNWRELLTEIGVIVVGVAIALAAEQGVEWLHWQSDVKAARASLQVEIAGNDTDFHSRRIDEDSCVKRQIAEAGRILDDLEAKRPPSRFTRFHLEIGNLMNFSEWESERAAQTLTHFPRKEVAVFGAYYDQLLDEKGWMVDESQAWHKLSVLRSPPKEVAIGDLLQLRAALANATEDNRLIVVNAKQQLARSRQLGVALKPFDLAMVARFCKPDP